MASRKDAYFELLATAAGETSARERTVGALRAAVLEEGGEGDAVAPSVVEGRIEALSVSDIEGLRSLSEGWGPAWDGGPFLEAAWRTALRHLEDRSKANPADLDPGAVLGAEADRVWGPRAVPDGFRWSDVGAAPRPLAHFRELSWAPLVDRSLSRSDLAKTPPLALRALRGRASVLDDSARAFLRDRCEDLPGDPVEATLVVETSLELDLLDVRGPLDDRSMSRLRAQVASRMDGLEDARELIPLAYLLLRPGWQSP